MKRFRPDETESKADVDTKHRVVTVEDDVADVPQNGRKERSRIAAHLEALEADDHGDDDEDGRFFGGGLNDEQNVRAIPRFY